ncbi:hypothetical protein E2C01_101135 [Portunus trituberculatus]|uniref:Uncharacterized protein n=1 Tax=Portunus trituberculatus TaxID=210409 RepID=A0A5B7KL75_PORTR|nr:hypothetical protein [Portunus trituberculatus]
MAANAWSLYPRWTAEVEASRRRTCGALQIDADRQVGEGTGDRLGLEKCRQGIGQLW